MPATSTRRLRVTVIVGLALANLMVWGLSIDTLYRSRQLYEQRAQTQTQNIASAMDQNISGSIDKIDQALQVVTDELEHQLAGKGIDDTAMATLLARHEKRLPEVEAFRVAQADGLVILGRGVHLSERTSWVDRDYFSFLRDHAEAGLQISKPLIGRVGKQAIINFARRYKHPDGRFAGVVSAPVAVSYFSTILSQLDLGRNGSIILRDADLGLITRLPSIPDKPAGQMGNSAVSKDFRELFNTGARTATYYTAASADGMARMGTFSRLSKAPMVIIATVAKDDYLQPWEREVSRTLAMVASFTLLSLLLGGFLLRSLKQTEVNRQKLIEGRAFVHDVINSLTEHIAVIDSQGTLIEVNDAWQNFAKHNCTAPAQETGVGANYLTICDQSGQQGGDAQALEVAAGLRSLLNGTLAEFVQEYPCHSPTEQRWFAMHAVPLRGAIKGAVLIHQNITERKQFEAAQQLAHRQMETQLAKISTLQVMLQEQAIRDPLTGLHNRRYLDETLPRELSRAKREGQPLAVILLDLDHFKMINDTYGHAAGDEVLKTLSDILMDGARESDVVCRYGGEEFLVVLPGMSPDQACQKVGIWQHRLAQAPTHFGAFTITVTLSAGVAGYPYHGADADTLVTRADAALYRSKAEGRNRVSCFEPDPTNTADKN